MVDAKHLPLPVQPKRSFSQPVLLSSSDSSRSSHTPTRDPSLPFELAAAHLHHHHHHHHHQRHQQHQLQRQQHEHFSDSSTSERAPIHATRGASRGSNVFQPQYDYLHPFASDSSEFAQSVTCDLCVEVFGTPLILQCCQRRLCSTCLRRWLRQAGGKAFGTPKGCACCPWCRAPVAVKDVSVDRKLKGVVDELDVACSNRRQGCEWVGPRKYLLVHVSEECVLTEVPPPRTAASTLFHLSLLDCAGAVGESPVTTLFPRAASALDLPLPSRYQVPHIPTRTFSAEWNDPSDEEDDSPKRSSRRRRPVPFKVAGARGSVLVPTRDQSHHPDLADRLALPRRSVSLDRDPRVNSASMRSTSTFRDEDLNDILVVVSEREGPSDENDRIVTSMMPTIPTRTFSASWSDEDEYLDPPRRPIPFKAAGARGSVLVPTRGQSRDRHVADRLPRPSPSSSSRPGPVVLNGDSDKPGSLSSSSLGTLNVGDSVGSCEDHGEDDPDLSSLVAEPGALEDDDHLSMSLYQYRRTLSLSSVER
ncbi:hypothetical protein HKX48_006151 [Thoreauomyces humboldtii]|nr:hypothetical protein HKX48_006151 [Thoreauomyces humboldtii]